MQPRFEDAFALAPTQLQPNLSPHPLFKLASDKKPELSGCPILGKYDAKIFQRGITLYYTSGLRLHPLTKVNNQGLRTRSSFERLWRPKYAPEIFNARSGWPLLLFF